MIVMMYWQGILPSCFVNYEHTGISGSVNSGFKFVDLVILVYHCTVVDHGVKSNVYSVSDTMSSSSFGHRSTIESFVFKLYISYDIF